MSDLRTPQMNITVAASPDSNAGLSNDIRLLKAALLYADTVSLCSPTASWYLSRLRFNDLTDERERFEFVLRDSNLDERERALVLRIFEHYVALRHKKDRTSAENAQLEEMRKRFAEVWGFIGGDVTADAREAGMSELEPLIQRGLVTLLPITFDMRLDFAGEYLRTVGEAVISGTTYPLFDPSIGFLVQAAIQDGLISPSPLQVKHSRMSMLSGDILQRLPQFEQATFDEIVQIRSELAAPLARFRGAVLGYSNEMQTAPWEADFRLEAEHVFVEKIRPAVLDIEEAAKDNSLARALLYKTLTDNGKWKPAALGLTVGALSLFPQFAAAALAGGAAMAAVVELARIWAEVQHEQRGEERKIERSQLYFVYQAGRLIEQARR